MKVRADKVNTLQVHPHVRNHKNILWVLKKNIQQTLAFSSGVFSPFAITIICSARDLAQMDAHHIKDILDKILVWVVFRQKIKLIESGDAHRFLLVPQALHRRFEPFVNMAFFN